jgi:hypothetical protein
MLRIAVAALVCITWFSGPTPVFAQKYGSGFVIQHDEGENPGITANDLYTLFDNSIGNKHGGVIAVFGGCYTSDFSNAAKDHKFAEKPVAIMAATSKTDKSECSPALDGGAPFLSSALESLYPYDLNTGKFTSPSASEAYGSTTKSFTGKIDAQNKKMKELIDRKEAVAVKASNPAFTPLAGGEKLTFEGPKNIKKYAIIVMGKPETYFDWVDFQQEYQRLKDAGYEIKAFFGTGAIVTKGDEAGTPLLTKDDYKPGRSVAADARARSGAGVGVSRYNGNTYDDGKGNQIAIPFKAATYQNIKTAIAQWKIAAMDDKNGTNQYFFSVGTHSTQEAQFRQAKDLTISQATTEPLQPRSAPVNPLRSETGGELAQQPTGRRSGRGSSSPPQETTSLTATPVALASWSPLSPTLVELMGWGGGAAASSFGANYNMDFWGGRVAARLPVEQFRLQADIQGERSADYSAAVGYRAYVAGGLHLDWALSSRAEIGAFGGYQDAKPTFHGPESTNYFVGLEGRYSFGPALFGAQFGRFDVSNGPGTLTDAWFAEGRVRLSLGEVFRAPLLNYTTIGAEIGYGAGTLSGRNMGAQTTYWGARLMQGFAGTPISVFAAYEHFENRVDGLGQVWKEDLVKGGIKMVLPGSIIGLQPKEPTEPLPFLLRTVTNF